MADFTKGRAGSELYSVVLSQLHKILLLSALIHTVLQPAARADSAYVITAKGTFGVLDFGAHTYTQLGSFPQIFSGLGFDAKNNLYTVEVATGHLYKLNPANGNSTLVGSGTGVANFMMTSLTNGALYEIDFNNNLISINSSTGVGTIIGKMALPFPTGQDQSSLAGGIGILYYALNDPTLPDPYASIFKIDPANCCTPTRIGTDTGLNAIGAIGYVNGALYGFDNVSRNVLRIDLLKGTAVAVFAFPGVMATDTVTGVVDVTLGQRVPGRLSAGGPSGQLISVNVDGSNSINLAPSDNGQFIQSTSAASQPSIALNGTVAFSSNRSGTGNRVYVMNADGTGARQITFRDATGADDNFPAISPDGSKVAFISRRALSANIPYQKVYIVNTDGTGMRQLDAFTFDSNGKTQDADSSVAWSPESTRLVFRGVRLSNACNPKGALAFQDVVGTINVDGSGEKDLACNSSAHSSVGLDWSPDGSLIAFTRSTDLGDPAVSVIDPTGAVRYSLGASLVGNCGTPHCIHFSPDNSRLAFPVSSGSFNGIGIVNLDGSGRTLAANLGYAPDNLWWTPGTAIPAPAKMTLAPDPAQAWPGHPLQLVPSLLDASGNLITHAVTGYSSKAGFCESIDAAGLMTVDPSHVNNVASLAAVNGGISSNTVEVDCLTGAPACTYSLNSTSTSVAGSASNGSVNVTTQPGCTWTAISNASWLTVAQGSGGAGSGAAGFSIAANPGGARIGTLTIAGITYTVNQAPVPAMVNPNGIVNNASYTIAGNTVSPGSIAAIFGTNLTDGRTCLPSSNCFPTFGDSGLLNTTLAGTQVTINGIAAPMFYASPVQLGVQIPWEVAGPTATLQVFVGGQPGPSQAFQVAAPSPGIFTQTQDGKGAGAITHVDGSIVTSANPATAGELVIIYATGLGPITPSIATGGLPTIPSTTVTPVSVTFGGVPATPDYAGVAGCCVGLNQINVRVPSGIVPNFLVPVVVSVGTQQSNTTTIALQ